MNQKPRSYPILTGDAQLNGSNVALFAPRRKQRHFRKNVHDTIEAVAKLTTGLSACGGDGTFDLNNEHTSCYEALAFAAKQYTLKPRIMDDARHIQFPRFQIHHDIFEFFKSQLGTSNRVEMARKCIDMARRMYNSSLYVFQQAAAMSNNTTAAGIKKRKKLIRRAIHMQCHVSSTNLREFEHGSISAAWLLYVGYIFIRWYEMYPLAPLQQNNQNIIQVNLERIAEDKVYNEVMGTRRMTPNRLGISESVRAIWNATGIPDPNYLQSGTGLFNHAEFPEFPFQSQVLKQHVNEWQKQMQHKVVASGMNTNNQNLLYSNVNEDDMYGPERVAIVRQWFLSIGLATQALNETNVSNLIQHSDYIKLLQLKNLTQDTDAARALMNIHSHFIPPISSVSIQDVKNPLIGPLILNDKTHQTAFMTIMTRYTPETWPFPTVPWSVELAQPVLTPSGKSLPNRHGPPYIFVAPTNKDTLVPLDPVAVAENKQWDIRVACHFLRSNNNAMLQSAMNFATEQASITNQLKQLDKDAHDNISSVPSLPHMWKEGPVVNPIRMPPTRTILPTPPTSNLPTATLSNNHMLVVDTNHLPWLVENQNIASLSDVTYKNSLIFRHRVPTEYLARYTLERFSLEQQGRMLHHALYLLQGPVTEWFQKMFHDSRKTAELMPPPPAKGSREVGSLTFGELSHGYGMFQRKNNGKLQPSAFGWTALGNPFGSTVAQFVAGRSFKAHPPDFNLPSQFRQSDTSIGPLALDPNFGLPNHIPGATTYNVSEHEQATFPRVYVTRTNQIAIPVSEQETKPTWGLDFVW